MCQTLFRHQEFDIFFPQVKLLFILFVMDSHEIVR